MPAGAGSPGPDTVTRVPPESGPEPGSTESCPGAPTLASAGEYVYTRPASLKSTPPWKKKKGETRGRSRSHERGE